MTTDLFLPTIALSASLSIGNESTTITSSRPQPLTYLFGVSNEDLHVNVDEGSNVDVSMEVNEDPFEPLSTANKEAKPDNPFHNSKRPRRSKVWDEFFEAEMIKKSMESKDIIEKVHDIVDYLNSIDAHLKRFGELVVIPIIACNPYRWDDSVSSWIPCIKVTRILVVGFIDVNSTKGIGVNDIGIEGRGKKVMFDGKGGE
ncbi:hypothetical protein L6452_01549 [Arctium lappa]|uniref:Uncharacterized protein n=1 Tax=Arctium lappa TaxID=4217 RepID=A0ACB9FGY9_ARCLA|nr:hypothetical protein L6452_01549 [Arctium lappa]